MPVGPSGVAVKFVNANSFALAAPSVGSKNVDAARKFLKYIVTGERLEKFSLTAYPHLIPPLKGVQEKVIKAGAAEVLNGREDIGRLAFDTSNSLDFESEAGAVFKDGKVIRSGVVNPYIGSIVARGVPAEVVQRVVIQGEDPAKAAAGPGANEAHRRRAQEVAVAPQFQHPRRMTRTPFPRRIFHDPRSGGSGGRVSARTRQVPARATMIDSYYAPAVAAGIRFQFDPEMKIHVAHALMLAERKIVDRSEIAQILATLLELRQSGVSALTIDYEQEDLYSYIERFLVERLGLATGGRLHTGRSRNDMHTTSWRLALRARLLDLLKTVLRLRRTLLDLAEMHIDTVMPGYTHTQHAQPISFGYYLLSAADLVERDFRRLASALSCCDRSPLGSGALSTTGFPIDREMTSRLLGFSGLVEVGYDGVAIRDDVHEAVGGLRS